MEDIVLNNPDTEVNKIKELLREEALLIREDINVCKSIGEYGLSIQSLLWKAGIISKHIPPENAILTICH